MQMTWDDLEVVAGRELKNAKGWRRGEFRTETGSWREQQKGPRE